MCPPPAFVLCLSIAVIPVVALKVFLNYCEHLNSKAVEAHGSA